MNVYPKNCHYFREHKPIELSFNKANEEIARTNTIFSIEKCAYKSYAR